tara:strand:- start:696048 stop:697604 length:1557 start_codon:yes stop_codon:yes gene_type:complete
MKHSLSLSFSLAVFLFALARLTPQCCSAAESVSDLPNFVFVLADNLGYGDIGCFGSTKHRTPNLNRMAAEGVRLTSFYSTAPVCTPSRASLMTGCYPRRVGLHVDANGIPVLRAVTSRGLNPDETTIAELLQSRGYVTACIGKWHLGDQPPFMPRRHGFDSFFGLPYSEDMTEKSATAVAPARAALPLIEGDTVIEAPPDRATLTGRFTDRAVEFIRQNKDRPFFLYLPHTMPGSTLTSFASEPFRGKSENGTYGDAVEELDWSIGQVLDAIKANGIDEKTLVVWTSDNGAIWRQSTANENKQHGRDEEYGLGSNHPMVGWAYSTDEGGMRMPFVARWPGRIPAASVSDELTTMMDIFPTFAGLVGMSTTTKDDQTTIGNADGDAVVVDGKDIWPLLSAKADAKSPYEAFYYYYLSQLQAVRSGQWKLYLPLKHKWETFKGDGGPSMARLVDLVNDPLEQTNLAQTHPKVVQRLMGYAERARTELGDIGRPGSAQRPAGHYPNPRPLWYSGPMQQRPQ